jgi:hypothetical protein
LSNFKDLTALYTPLIPAKAGTQVFFVTESELRNPSQAAEHTKKPGSPLWLRLCFAVAGMSGIEYGPPLNQ